MSSSLVASHVAKLALIAAILLGALVHHSEAIFCWQCNSATVEFCKDVPAGAVANVSTLPLCYKEMYKECESSDDRLPYTFCRTQEQTIQGKKRVIRSCGYDKAAQDCYQTKTPSVATKVCQCFTDGCNSASSLGLGALTALIALAINRFLVN